MMTNLESFELNGIIQISDREFKLISELVYEKFGINLSDKKKALVSGRLNKLIKKLGFTNFSDYYEAVINDNSGNSLLYMIDKISTNHSFFFRESDHFDFLKAVVLPEIFKELREKNLYALRIWSAGCAAGEEAYSISMIMDEFFSFERMKWDIGILATDISLSALKQAEEGLYQQEKIKMVPKHFIKKYLNRLKTDHSEDLNLYSVNPKIKEMVLFKRLNLMRESYPFKGKFHIIFCRNVMIYFDQETRRELIARLHRYMHEGAYLFIGHSESLGRDNSLYQYIQPAVYRKCGNR
jgi:chemotaxis protein methyltransferase CheR